MDHRPAPLRRVRGRFFFTYLALSVLVPGVASSHDLWMVAGKYRLKPRETTRVFITSGDHFPESLSLLGEQRVSSLVLYGPSGKETLSTFRVDGKALSFDLRPKEAGSHILALATRSRRVRLKAEDFEDYLSENGLSTIETVREQLGESDKATVERYAKWAKTAITVEGEVAAGAPPAWSKPVGHRIEIVPNEDPNALLPGDTLDVRVLFENEPLAGATVSAGLAGGPAGQVKARTDENGHASLTFREPGRWYLRSIYMVRRDHDPEVDWESFWCTLTFEMRAEGDDEPS